MVGSNEELQRNKMIFKIGNRLIYYLRDREGRNIEWKIEI